MKYILALIITLITLASFGQLTIKPEEAKNHVNKIVEIRGNVSEIIISQNSKKAIVINIGGKSPNQLVSIIIPADVRSKLAFDLNQKINSLGALIVQGKVSLSKGKPTIVISDPKQLGFIYDEEVVPSN